VNLSVAQRARRSLRLRLLAATVVLIAAALGVAAVLFERVARSVALDAVHHHLAARASEVLEAVARFQRERALIAHDWSEAEAVQMSLDSLDPKFVEDYLRRTIQDQGGTIHAAALVDTEQKVVGAVRYTPGGVRRGEVLPGRRGHPMGLAPAREVLLSGAEVAVGLAPLRTLDPDAPAREPALFIAAQVTDFASDLVGAIVIAVPADAVARLLGEIVGAGAYRPLLADERGRMLLTGPGEDAEPLRALLFAVEEAPGPLESFEVGGEELLVVRTARHAEEPRWQTAMILPEQAALGGVRKVRWLLAWVFAAVLVAAAVASILAVRQAAQPLADVSTSMEKVAGGDLTTRIPEGWSGELGTLVRSFNGMVTEVARSRDELRRTEALRREVQIAHRIQTAILPRSPAAAGFDIAARMKPAEDVGGDLYDVLEFGEPFWVLIGDVSGHGINSGLVMMMAQAAACAAIQRNPGCAPAEVIAAVNRVVHENVRARMRRDDYMTLMAARHVGAGRFVAAGAHQPVFLVREGGRVEVVEPAGTWVGLAPDVGRANVEYEFALGPGDAACLITDGIIEARGRGNELYGEERLARLLSGVNGGTAAETLDRVFAEVEGFMDVQADDMTAVVLRRVHA
jgi:sigma-B regulation protein RsbU (phosphoserine phosphatase)